LRAVGEFRSGYAEASSDHADPAGSTIQTEDSDCVAVRDRGSVHCVARESRSGKSCGDPGIFVVTAGGGLKSLLVVLALSVALALLSTRPVWERLYIAVSGLPIGLVCGVFRVTAGCVFVQSGIEWFGRMVLFEFAGWATMVLAWSLLRTQRVLLSRLLIPPPARDVVPVLAGARMSDASSIPVAASAMGSPHARRVVNSGMDEPARVVMAIAEESTAAEVTGRRAEVLVAVT
jgi:exosortase/archaeosortase family protein